MSEPTKLVELTFLLLVYFKHAFKENVSRQLFEQAQSELRVHHKTYYNVDQYHCFKRFLRGNAYKRCCHKFVIIKLQKK